MPAAMGEPLETTMGEPLANSELIQHVTTDVTPTTSLVTTFNQPGLAPNFIETVMERKVCLEKACMESPSVIYGVVRVLNIAFNKSVTIRWTVIDWATHKEMDCKYEQGSSRGNMDKVRI